MGTKVEVKGGEIKSRGKKVEVEKNCGKKVGKEIRLKKTRKPKNHFNLQKKSLYLFILEKIQKMPISAPPVSRTDEGTDGRTDKGT